MLSSRNLKYMVAAGVAAIGLSATGASATPFTTTSPLNGGQALPGGVTEIGGIVLDLVGANDIRVVSQLPASSLFVGFSDTGTPSGFQGNPLTIGIQTGFDSSITGQLGGGLKGLSVRITLEDGDTGIGDFDENQNDLLLNGSVIDDFTNVMAQETTSDGLTELDPPDPGFENNVLETGFFSTSDATTLSSVFSSMVSTEEIIYQLDDVDPTDNFFDFTQGIDGGLIDVGQGPTVQPPSGQVPEPATLGMFGIGLAGLGFAARRRKAA